MLRLACACAFLAAPAFAQQQVPCHPHAEVVEALGSVGEVVQARAAMARGGGHLEIWANPVTGTWTAVIVSADGQTGCVPAFGDGFHLGAAKVDPA